MQEFPFSPRVAGRFDGLHEFLDAAVGVRERAALLGMGAARQNVVRQLRRFVRQDVADDERVERVEQFRREAVFVHDFAGGFALAQLFVADRA